MRVPKPPRFPFLLGSSLYFGLLQSLFFALYYYSFLSFSFFIFLPLLPAMVRQPASDSCTGSKFCSHAVWNGDAWKSSCLCALLNSPSSRYSFQPFHPISSRGRGREAERACGRGEATRKQRARDRGSYIVYSGMRGRELEKDVCTEQMSTLVVMKVKKHSSTISSHSLFFPLFSDDFFLIYLASFLILLCFWWIEIHLLTFISGALSYVVSISLSLAQYQPQFIFHLVTVFSSVAFTLANFPFLQIPISNKASKSSPSYDQNIAWTSASLRN